MLSLTAPGSASGLSGRLLGEGSSCRKLGSVGARVRREFVLLSYSAVLIFVLQSGVRGQLTTGRVERYGPTSLSIYDSLDMVNEYISGANLRSWCIQGADGKPLAGWCEVVPEDRPRIPLATFPA
jgi:hypothetical protein